MSTSQKRKNLPPHQSVPPNAPAWPLQARCSHPDLLSRFRKLFGSRLADQWAKEGGFYLRAFTLRIALWYMALKYLLKDGSLDALLADARAGGADSLSPRGKRLSRQIQSPTTASLSDARHRLPLELIQKALLHSGRQIGSWVDGALWKGLRVILFDGSTVRLRPDNDIPRQFHQHRPGNTSEPYWCLARVVVGFCMATGAVVNSVIDTAKLSEQALALRFLTSDCAQSLIVADRNFGVYSFVRAATRAGAAVLARLTKSRALKIARQNGAGLKEGIDAPLTWTPSRADQSKLEKIPVQGRLLVWRVHRRGFRPLTLYLWTSLLDRKAFPPEQLLELYGARWQAELNLRYLKTQMGIESINCKSAQMVRKEWFGALLGYNLVRAVMTAAAGMAKIPVLALSFTHARNALIDWLVRSAHHPRSRPAWKRLLEIIAAGLHPRRSKPRPSEPRAIRYVKNPVPKLIGSRAAARKKLKHDNSKS